MSAQEVAIVTGAGSGIGRATAVRLASRGARVGLFDLSAEGLEATAALIRAGGGTALVHAGDVTVEDEIRAAVAAVSSELGPLKTAVASAGVEVMGTATEMDVNDWHKVIAVNLTGVFLTARHAIPAIIEAGGGSFVGMSSDAGVQGAQGFAAYVASKHGVVGLVRSLALDHGPQGVRCNAVAPGFVHTPMADRIFEGLSEEEIDGGSKTVPLGRFARALFDCPELESRSWGIRNRLRAWNSQHDRLSRGQALPRIGPVGPARWSGGQRHDQAR